VWQALYEELNGKGFTVIAVALESRGAATARPWIEHAKPTYPCLIDADHSIARAYNMINVPQAVWIDESGRIVRPTETAGVTEGFRKMNPTTFEMPKKEMDEGAAARGRYLDSIRDWVANGSTSKFVLDAAEAKRRTPRFTDDIARAHATFRLGRYLVQHGRRDEGLKALEAATQLDPDSWSIWRQMADLDTIGKSGGPEFWARVRALGSKHYYAPVDMPGEPRR
jgi:AhpC/TSA family/Tetratricopeptide repeat